MAEAICVAELAISSGGGGEDGAGLGGLACHREDLGEEHADRPDRVRAAASRLGKNKLALNL